MIGGITMGQFIPGESLLHRLDPRTKVVCVIISALAVFAVQQWFTFALLAGFVFLTMLLTGIPLRIFFRSLRTIWILLTITFLVQTFFTPGEPLFSIGFLSVSREGLSAGMQIFIRLSLLVLIAFLLTLTTSPLNLTAGLENILSPLKRIGVPAHELAMIMTIAMRFVPILLAEADKVLKAQRSRGTSFSSGGLLTRAKGLLPLFVPLFAGALRSADELAVAMEARCYRGGANRTRMNSLMLGRLDYLALFFTLALFATTVGLRYI